MHHLSEIKINKEQSDKIMGNDENRIIIKELSRAFSFSWMINSSSEIWKLSKWKLIYPSHWNYFIFSNNKSESGCFGDQNLSKIPEYLSDWALRSIDISFIVKPEEYNIIKLILNLPNVQTNLAYLKLIHSISKFKFTVKPFVQSPKRPRSARFW